LPRVFRENMCKTEANAQGSFKKVFFNAKIELFLRKHLVSFAKIYSYLDDFCEICQKHEILNFLEYEKDIFVLILFAAEDRVFY
jgi:hypothetical protein